MSRLKVIFFFIIATALVVGIFVLQYIFSLHSVKITLSNNVSANIYKVIDNRNEQPFRVIKSSSTLFLQNGRYCLTPSDSNYNSEPNCFIVDGSDTSINFDPDYSEGYLGHILGSQQETINNIITKKYSPLINSFTLKTGMLFRHGEWYGTTLTQKVAKSSQGDVYRLLMKKVDDKWSIVAYPQIVLNKYDYSQVPYEVLDKVNRLTGVQGQPFVSKPRVDPLFNAYGD